MGNISTWSTTAANNNQSPPNGWPEGMAPSDVNNCAREDKAAIRRWYNEAQWLDYGFTYNALSGTQFEVTATSTATGWFTVGRRVKIINGASTIYGYVSEASISATKTNVTCTFDATASLNSSLSTVSVGIIDSKYKSLPLSSRPSIIQSKITTIVTGLSTSAVIPFDNTKPQITEGAQYTNVTITPTDASNILVIEVFIPIITVSTQGSVVFQSAIFLSPNADALCASYGGTYNQNHTLKYEMTAGTTSAITFTFRFGSAGSGTVYCNDTSGGVAYGGSNVAFMKVTEYQA